MVDRTYRTEIPNLVLELGLDPYELALYAQIKRTAGDSGKCWKGLRSLAKGAGMSIGKASQTKKSLLAWGLIQPAYPGTEVVEVVDIWNMNKSFFSNNCSPHEQGCSPHEQGCSPHEQGCSPHEQGVHQVNKGINQLRKNPKRNKPKEEEEGFEPFPFDNAPGAFPSATQAEKHKRRAAKLIEGVTKMPLLPGVIERLEAVERLIDMHGAGKTEGSLEKAFKAWTHSTTKEGKPYSVTNYSWIDWAVEYATQGVEPQARNNGNSGIDERIREENFEISNADREFWESYQAAQKK